eukprot:SAG31_NODE_697_length_12745_cov_67.888502_8_plen_40_part_00
MHIAAISFSYDCLLGEFSSPQLVQHRVGYGSKYLSGPES